VALDLGEVADFDIILADLGETITWRKVGVEAFDAATGIMTDVPVDTQVLAILFGPSTQQTMEVPEADLMLNCRLPGGVTRDHRFEIDGVEYEVLRVRVNSRIEGEDNIEIVWLKKKQA